MMKLSLNENVIRTRGEDPIVWSGGSAAEQVTHDDDDGMYIMVGGLSDTKVIISVFKGFSRFSCF